MKPLSEMTPEEVAALNQQTEAELKGDLKQIEAERVQKVSSAFSLLTESIESETIEIPFGGKGILKVLANPSKNIRKKLAEIGEKSMKVANGAALTEKESEKIEGELASILAQIVIEPKASEREWRTYPYLEEVAGKVIFHVVLDMQKHQEAMKTELESFRSNARSTKNIRNSGVTSFTPSQT